jgi:ferric-dicitrate binding protein FerR (iron transport regulator)
MERENNNMENTRYEALIAAYLSGNITAVEKDDLMRWVAESEPNRKFFEELVDLWAAAAGDDAEPWPTPTEVAWQKLEGKLFPAAEKMQPQGAAIRPLRSQRVWIRPVAAAAAIALLIVAGWQWQQQRSANQWVAVTTAPGERRQIELPDGSQVWLNAGSTLRYQAGFQERTLELVGEAFFEVATDSLHPFRVVSGEAITTVLGTAFNLRAYPDEPEVQLKVAEGRVALSKKAAPAQRVELAAGQEGRYEKPQDELVVAESPDENALAWKEQRLIFKDESLDNIARAIRSYYGVEVEIEKPALGACRFTGQYDSISLEDLTAILSATMNLDIDRTVSNRIRIGGEGCQ